MNTKFRFLLLTSATLALASVATGCLNGSNAIGHVPIVGVDTNGIVSVAGHDIQPQAVGNTLHIAGQAGTIAALHYDPNSRAYLEATDVLLTAAIGSGTYDPTLLNNSLATISIKEAHDPNVTAGIESALGVYSMFFGSLVTANITNVSPYAEPALTGLRDGIAAGLALSPVSITNVIPIP